MLNKLHVFPFQQVSHPSQRNNSGSALLYSLFNLHKKSPHQPVSMKLPLPSRSRSADVGVRSQEDLIQFAQGRPDHREEPF